MNFRVTDSRANSDLTSRINSQQTRVATLQEIVTSGKRINRPSDDPEGTEMVLNLRTSQTEIQQFQRNAQAATEKLTASDDALNTYQTVLDRVRTIVTQGLSDTTSQAGKDSLATELDALKSRILNIANTKNGDDYVFGGTRQTAPPYDPATGTPAATTTSAQYIQIEPGVNAIPVSVTADTIFADSTSTIFADLTSAVAALRGTGDATADRATLDNANSRLQIYSDQSDNARAVVGANMNAADSATDSLTTNFSTLDQRASSIENADFAQSAVNLSSAQQTLDASLQVAAAGKKSLFDYF